MINRYLSIVERNETVIYLIYGQRAFPNANLQAVSLYKGDLKAAIDALEQEERKAGLQDVGNWQLKFFKDRVKGNESIVREITKQAETIGANVMMLDQ